MALTSSQMTAVRRYMGFPAVGTTMPISASQDVVYLWFGMVQMSLYARLTTLTADEETVVINTYLTNLATLEQAIFDSTQNLDTDQAAVWTHNKNEVSDRSGLFNRVRRQLCEFLGCTPGPGLSTGGSNISLVRA